jgi:hypothetical protein
VLRRHIDVEVNVRDVCRTLLAEFNLVARLDLERLVRVELDRVLGVYTKTETRGLTPVGENEGGDVVEDGLRKGGAGISCMNEGEEGGVASARDLKGRRALSLSDAMD